VGLGARAVSRRRTAGLLACTVFAACSTSPDANDPDGELPTEVAVRLVSVLNGLSSPVLAMSPPADPRLFVVEQPGRIRIARGGSVLPVPFLDLTGRVSSGGERGLLGLAFAPDFATSGRFFVNFTDRDGDTRVESFRSAPGGDVADATSSRLWLQVDQPFSNHNGGHLEFGPDGMLYVGMGDGGSGGDPQGHGQNRATLLGALLRLDVSPSEPPYRVPPDNPFVGQAGTRGEIWHYGLRNPWRFAFDRVGGMLWIGDVGQQRWEEIDAVPVATKGANFGWADREGRDCYRASPCPTSGLTAPVHVYSHDAGCSVTGGRVYRGNAIPALRGAYVFSDFCSGWLRAARMSAGDSANVFDLQTASPGNVTSFGEDANGELLVITQQGSVYRLEAAP